jgi:DMSO/TMAO reductase YedYZ molybdopterin-dependent catalytic subunit
MAENGGMAAAAQGKGTPVGRRMVLAMAGLGAAGIVFGSRMQNLLNDALAPLQRLDPTGLTGLLPGNYFRIYTVTDGYPVESDSQYRLAVDGLVERPAVYTLGDLKAMPSATLVRDFQCVTGWRVTGVHWTGVVLSDLLDAAGVTPAARALRFYSFDGVYTESLTLDEARRSDVMVAYEMDGAPLSTEHGGPARLYVAPMYGYKSIKWLSRIELTDQVIPGFWETEGNYSVEAWVGRSNGRNDPPIG